MRVSWSALFICVVKRWECSFSCIFCFVFVLIMLCSREKKLSKSLCLTLKESQPPPIFKDIFDSILSQLGFWGNGVLHPEKRYGYFMTMYLSLWENTQTRKQQKQNTQTNKQQPEQFKRFSFLFFLVRLMTEAISLKRSRNGKTKQNQKTTKQLNTNSNNKPNQTKPTNQSNQTNKTNSLQSILGAHQQCITICQRRWWRVKRNTLPDWWHCTGDNTTINNNNKTLYWHLCG